MALSVAGAEISEASEASLCRSQVSERRSQVSERRGALFCLPRLPSWLWL